MLAYASLVDEFTLNEWNGRNGGDASSELVHLFQLWCNESL